MPRFLLSLAAALFLADHAGAQPSGGAEEPAASQHCEDTVTPTCLVDEIRSFLASDMDPFKRERAMLALAQAQLAEGNIEQALTSYAELEASTARAEFLVSHAKRLIADGDNALALERLRAAEALLTEGQGEFDRLNVTWQRQLIAETFAQAGMAEEGRAILDEIAGYRNRIPLNPMLLALMLQVGEAQADIGFGDEGAVILGETYELALDQEIEIAPEQVLQIFEVWTTLDPLAATTAAEELAAVFGEDGPSAFEFAIWTGVASGREASDSEIATFIDRAQASWNDAPERAAVLLLAPKLAEAMRAAGEDDQAHAVLDRAREEAGALASPAEKAPTYLALAEGFARADAPETATEILNDLLAMSEEQGQAGMITRHFASMAPARLALLGKVDEAYDLAMQTDSGSREMALVAAADKLALQGDFPQALRFLREVESEIAVMMMAGIADRLAYASTSRQAQ